MPSRRAFLHLAGCAVPGLLLRPPARFDQRLGIAFGLFFDAERQAMLQRLFREQPLFASLRMEMENFDRAAERRFITSEVRTNDHLYDIARLHNTAPRMAFLYAMTGDEGTAALAADAVRAILRFPKWDYFLDGSTDVIGIQRASGAVVAVACTADWLGNYLDDDERAAWLRVMGERGCEPCFRSIYGMRYPEQVRGWGLDPESTYLEHRPYDRDLDLTNWPHILDRTNLKAVPASALAIGASAYEHQFGRNAATDRWIEQAVFSIRSFGDLYAPDGSYDEGISYANYTSQHLAQATEVLHRTRGLDLYDVINWPGFIDYAVGLTMPTADDPYAVVNFGDAGTGLRSDVPFWVAARSGDGRAQWFGEAMAHAHTEWSVIWYRSARQATAPPDGPQRWRSDLDWITARTGYAPDDLVVAMRSGGPSNHEHADRGSLIVKCFGEVLVADPYRPPYSNDDPAWLLRTTAGHSALLIDGQSHQYHDGAEGTNASDAVARITREGRRDGYFYWTSDATPAYRLVLFELESVTRTVVTLYDIPAVVLLDKVVKTGAPSQLQARFFADNRDGQSRIEASGNTFQTLRPLARLYAFGYAPGGVGAAARQLSIPDEQAAQHPFAEMATAVADAAPLLVSVLLPVRSHEPEPAVTFSDEEGYLAIRIDSRGRRARCRIADTGTLPEFVVEV